VRSDEHDCWHCFSDSRVTRVAASAVLASPAFLLFYERFSSA
jgi:ubiquitin C-terminal hydrolase